MRFKEGDRVRVIKLNNSKVDFYATLKGGNDGNPFTLTGCSEGRFEGSSVFKPNTGEVGTNKWDYYTLAEDEEDTEVPVVQHTKDIHDPVNKPSHYMLGDIEVKDVIAIVADKYHKGSVAHNVASALEYLMRSPDKNGLEDIKKARKCLEFAIENWE